jgi:hypothetical protein
MPVENVASSRTYLAPPVSVNRVIRSCRGKDDHSSKENISNGRN